LPWEIKANVTNLLELLDATLLRHMYSDVLTELSEQDFIVAFPMVLPRCEFERESTESRIPDDLIKYGKVGN